jgi:hypothetical protein
MALSVWLTPKRSKTSKVKVMALNLRTEIIKEVMETLKEVITLSLDMEILHLMKTDRVISEKSLVNTAVTPLLGPIRPANSVAKLLLDLPTQIL